MISQRAKRAGLKELEIFDYFVIDRNLPKYVNRSEEKSIDGSFAIAVTNTATESNNTIMWGVPSEGDISEYEGNRKRFTLRERIGNFIIGKKNIKQPKRLMSTLDLFINLSKSYKELSSIAEIAEHYEKALVQAQSLGQTALFEKLGDLVSVVRGEAILIAMGLNKYVTEKQICDFYEMVSEDKNLKLTWIKNFNRIIPEEIYEIKKDVDERKIFDNYVILHYDPENNGEELSKEELEKKKDPILFGVIKNSKKLYYIADWKDDYCELTLEEMFTTLGEKVLKINNRNVKTFLNEKNI